jgi:5-methylcytosine-specific restriction endonuclease McrA
MEAHHIIPLYIILKKYNISFSGITKEELILNAQKYEKLWDINNGITLCRDCHIKEDTTRGRRQ